MRKGAPKLFHLGGHSSTNKTSNIIPPKTIPHTHSHTDIHTGTNRLLVPRRRAESSRSSVTTLDSVNSAAAARKLIISHPNGSRHSEQLFLPSEINSKRLWFLRLSH